MTVKNNCYSSGTKIAKDKITLKVLARDYSGGITNYNNCALTKYIEKEMNMPFSSAFAIAPAVFSVKA